MIGKTISHYKILEKLGEGGMGVVYKAEDTKLRRTVALKFLSPQTLGTQEEKTRFIHEAQAAAALDHPNICTVHEIDEAEGRTFIAMAYIEGVSLKAKIQSGPLKVDEALDVAIDVAQGLEEAHEKNIVHRDIKSANIMITAKGQAKITDFGLAKLAGSTKVTKTGMTVGTVAYMSPEQARGEDVDQRTDIWSLGVVLYEMLAGLLPFKGDYEQAVTYNIVHENPEPITGLRTGIPLELERIVNKCLEKKPSDRYQHVDELVVDLRWVQKQLLSASEPAIATAKVPRRRLWVTKQVTWMIMLILIVLIGAVIVFYPSLGVPFSERDWMLITDFENQTGEDVFDDVIREALAIDLQQSQYVNVYSRQRVAEVLERMGREDMPNIDENVGMEIALREDIKAVLVGSINKIGDAYILNARIVNPSTGDAVKTERVEARSSDQVLDAIDDLSRQVRRNLGESLSSIEERDMPLDKVTTTSLDALRYYSLATKYLYKAKWNEAIPLFKKAIEEDSSFAIAYSKLAVMYANVYNTKEALIYSALALDRRDRVTDRERYYIEAEYYRYRGDLKKAIEKYKLLLQLYPDDFTGHNNLSFTYQFTRQYEEALKHSKEAARIAPDSWYPYHNMAGIYAGLGDYEKSAENSSRALSINPEGHWAKVVGSWASLCLGDSVSAIRELSELPSGNESWQSIKMRYLSLLYRALGKDNRALDCLQQGILVDERAGRDQAQSWKWGETANIFLEKGKVDRALNALSRSVEVFRTSRTLMKLGIGYASAGFQKQAEDVLEELQDRQSEGSIHTDLAKLERLEGEISYAKKDFLNAVRYLETSNFLRDDLETRFSLGRSFLAAKRYDDAIREFEYILDHRYGTYFEGVPNLWPLSHYQLGIAYEEKGNLERALEYYRRFLAVWESADADRKEMQDAGDRIELLQAKR